MYPVHVHAVNTLLKRTSKKYKTMSNKHASRKKSKMRKKYTLKNTNEKNNVLDSFNNSKQKI